MRLSNKVTIGVVIGVICGLTSPLVLVIALLLGVLGVLTLWASYSAVWLMWILITYV
jgi:hypothetical protein